MQNSQNMPRLTESSLLPNQEHRPTSVTLEEALRILEESPLPEEIKREHSWEERLDDDEDPTIIVQEIRAVTAARAGRKQTTAASSIKFFDPEIRDRFGETNLTRLLERILDEHPKNIGEGKTAQVFARRLEQEGLSGYCIKMITDTHGAD